jgi:4-aminobutyrate aminotransferase/(S)-3-amino-2-methylpropionate transaminase
MGDPGKMILLEAVMKTIAKDNLLENVRKTGDHIVQGLESLEHKYPQFLNSSRGKGFIISVNCHTPERRDKFVHKLRLKGNKIIICNYNEFIN